MPDLIFLPMQQTVSTEENTKVLAAAVRNKIPMRFGCSSCRCGTCGVKVSGTGTLSDMKDDEIALLTRMLLPADGTIRLACQARTVAGTVEIDLDFQNEYSPDQGED